jgi:hypothetical protein
VALPTVPPDELELLDDELLDDELLEDELLDEELDFPDDELLDEELDFPDDELELLVPGLPVSGLPPPQATSIVANASAPPSFTIRWNSDNGRVVNITFSPF